MGILENLNFDTSSSCPSGNPLAKVLQTCTLVNELTEVNVSLDETQGITVAVATATNAQSNNNCNKQVQFRPKTRDKVLTQILQEPARINQLKTIPTDIPLEQAKIHLHPQDRFLNHILSSLFPPPSTHLLLPAQREKNFNFKFTESTWQSLFKRALEINTALDTKSELGTKGISSTAFNDVEKLERELDAFKAHFESCLYEQVSQHEFPLTNEDIVKISDDIELSLNTNNLQNSSGQRFLDCDEYDLALNRLIESIDPSTENFLDTSQHELNYSFYPQNPFIDMPINSLKTLLETSNNNLYTILALESIVQRNTDENNAQYWLTLGSLHQENENDTLAIPALHAALKCTPTLSLSLDIILKLAASYTNEGNVKKVFLALKSWLEVFEHMISNDVHQSSPLPIDLISSQILIPNSDTSHSLESNELLALPDLQSIQERLSSLAHKSLLPNFPVPIIIPAIFEALGIFSMATNNFKVATGYFESSLALGPNNHNPSSLNRLAAALISSGNPSAALKIYDTLLSSSHSYPLTPRCMHNISAAYFALGDKKKTLTTLIDILKLHHSWASSCTAGYSQELSNHFCAQRIWRAVEFLIQSCIPISIDIQRALTQKDISRLEKTLKTFYIN